MVKSQTVTRLGKKEFFSHLPHFCELALADKRQVGSTSGNTVVVLDDDPTGIQTVHGVSVYMDWTMETLRDPIAHERLFFIHTNTRAFSAERMASVNREIMTNVLRTAKDGGRKVTVISRGDSTLRGHYPLETRVLKEVYENETGISVDGEILIPFFEEGGRFTANDIHYVAEGEALVPVGETEFARDAAFGYSSSDLKQYVVEKHGGNWPLEKILSVPLTVIREEGADAVTNILLRAEGFAKVIVNACSYDDVRVFASGLAGAEAAGKHFIVRSAASFVKVYGGVSDKQLLSLEECVGLMRSGAPGLIVVGSHVDKTTAQVKRLVGAGLVTQIEIDVQRIIDGSQDEVIEQAARMTDRCILEGRTPMMITSRKVIRDGSSNREANLAVSARVSDALVMAVRSIRERPSYIVAKGGITSSDVAIKGLSVKKERVLGQILRGVPVVLLDSKSKWGEMPYVIFPGNVGDEHDFQNVVEVLDKARLQSKTLKGMP